MVVINCDTLFTVTGSNFDGAVQKAADPSGTNDDLHYVCHYDLNYLFRGLVVCVDQDAGAAGNVALAAPGVAAEPTVAYLRAQVNTATAYSSGKGTGDATAGADPANDIPEDGGSLGGRFVCLPDNVNGYDHTVNELKNLLYTGVTFGPSDTVNMADYSSGSPASTDVLGWKASANGFAKTADGGAKVARTATSGTIDGADVGAAIGGIKHNNTNTFSTTTSVVQSIGPIQYRGPMNALSEVLVVCDEDYGDTTTNLTLGSMMYVDAGLLAFTNNPNTNDILEGNGQGAHADANGATMKDGSSNSSLLKSMINDPRGLISLTDTSGTAQAGQVKTIGGVQVDNAVAVAGSGPMLEKCVGAVASSTNGYGNDNTTTSTGQFSCMFGRIMYDLIAGNAGRSIEASPRVGARNFVSDKEADGETTAADKTALGCGGTNTAGSDAAALYENAGAGSEKKIYLACRWLTGDSLKLTWEINYSGNALKVKAGDTNDLFTPSYLTKNTNGASPGTPGYVTVGLTVTHIDLCGDSELGYSTELTGFTAA